MRSPVETESPKPNSNAPTGGLRAALYAIRRRIISGLVLGLPIVLTFWIVHWLYGSIKQRLLDPLFDLVRRLLHVDGETSSWVLYSVVTPAISIILVLAALYFLGLFLRSKVHRAIDWFLLRLPVVTTIYTALSNVFESVGKQLDGDSSQMFQRVVLVEFPHPGCRALAFVTNTLEDATTHRKILCVCVLTGVMPPSGFTLYIPEDQVTDLDWTMNQSLQSILSGGITSPSTINYFGGAKGPLIDPHGHPFRSPPAQ